MLFFYLALVLDSLTLLVKTRALSIRLLHSPQESAPNLGMKYSEEGLTATMKRKEVVRC
jgi:hypothetical protein